jgi:hypothetical protein
VEKRVLFCALRKRSCCRCAEIEIIIMARIICKGVCICASSIVRKLLRANAMVQLYELSAGVALCVVSKLPPLLFFFF